MIRSTHERSQRRGSTTVELAFVIVIFTMLLFGILEYCLILYSQNIVENAAREGARYGIVNVTDTTMVADTQNQVKFFMSGMESKLQNYSCNVYLADATGKNIGTATSAQFGQYVCVEVKADYVPITPGLIFLKTFTIQSKSSMGSEAN